MHTSAEGALSSMELGNSNPAGDRESRFPELLYAEGSLAGGLQFLEPATLCTLVGNSLCLWDLDKRSRRLIGFTDEYVSPERPTAPQDGGRDSADSAVRHGIACVNLRADADSTDDTSASIQLEHCTACLKQRLLACAEAGSDPRIFLLRAEGNGRVAISGVCEGSPGVLSVQGIQFSDCGTRLYVLSTGLKQLPIDRQGAETETCDDIELELSTAGPLGEVSIQTVARLAVFETATCRQIASVDLGSNSLGEWG